MARGVPKHEAPRQAIPKQDRHAAAAAEDRALFREAIGPVRPLHAAAPPARAPRPEPRPRQGEADEAQALATARTRPFAVADPLAFEAAAHRRADVPERVLKRLRRGQYAVEDEIDLHHLSAVHARASLRRFLSEARRERAVCVRIVHGKGLRSSAGGPVLKPLVERTLAQRAEVLAYASAPAAQGGTGAVLALLAPRR